MYDVDKESKLQSVWGFDGVRRGNYLVVEAVNRAEFEGRVKKIMDSRQ